MEKGPRSRVRQRRSRSRSRSRSRGAADVAGGDGSNRSRGARQRAGSGGKKPSDAAAAAATAAAVPVPFAVPKRLKKRLAPEEEEPGNSRPAFSDIAALGSTQLVTAERVGVRVLSLTTTDAHTLIQADVSCVPVTVAAPGGARNIVVVGDALGGMQSIELDTGQCLHQGSLGTRGGMDPASGTDSCVVPFKTVALAGNSTNVVAACDDGTLRVWDAASGRAGIVAKGHKAGKLLDVTASPQADILCSVGSDMKLRTWDLATGANIAKLTPGGKSSSLQAVTMLSPNLAVTGDFEGHIRGTDLRSEKEVFDWAHHSVAVCALSAVGCDTSQPHVIVGYQYIQAQVLAAYASLAVPRVVATLDGHTLGPVSKVGAAGDRRHVFTNAAYEPIRIWCP